MPCTAAARGPSPRPAAHDVFEHHDRIVDDEAGCKHDRKQRQDVDRETGEIDRRKRADQRDRHRDCRNQRRTPVEQEEIDDEGDDEYGDKERDLHFVDRAIDEDRIVTGDLEFRSLRQDLRGDRVHHLVNTLGDIDRVRLGLTDDAEADALPTIGAQRRRARIRAERHRRDVPQPHIVPDDEIFELLGRLEVRRRSNGNVLAGAGERARRHVVGCVGERFAKIGHRDPTPGELRLVQVDAEDLLLVAVDRYIGDTLDCREPVADLVLDQQRHVFHGHRVGGQRQPHDRLAVRVRLDDDRLVCIVRQLAGNASERIANVIRRLANVGRVGEFERHAAAPEGRTRGNALEALDARYRAFDDRGHLAVDRFRRSAFEPCRHGNDRLVDLRQFAHFDSVPGGEAGNDDQRVDHQREDRPTDEKRGKAGLSPWPPPLP